MQRASKPRIAIVGSGPAGFFLADLLSKGDAAEVDLLERLPFPFGLVRYGVAPDHQGTKAVTRVFARAMERPNLRFFGGVELGRAVELEDLRTTAHAVVLATGASEARRMEFPGAELASCVSGFDLARWLNGHPDAGSFRLPERVRNVLIVGHGNVALDIARLLVMPLDLLAKSDIERGFLKWREGQRIEQVELCGRSTSGGTRFSPEMLRELQAVPGVGLARDEIDPNEERAKTEAAACVIEALPTRSEAKPEATVRLRFNTLPLSYDGCLVRLSRPAGTAIAADLVVLAIGQKSVPLPGLPYDEHRAGIANEDGVVAMLPGLFAIGWAAGLSRGTIPDSRATARRLAPAVLEHAAAEATRFGPRQDLEVLLSQRGGRHLRWSDWQRLDALEQQRGSSVGACRLKFTRLPSLGPSEVSGD